MYSPVSKTLKQHMKPYPLGVGGEIKQTLHGLPLAGAQNVFADRGRLVVRVPRDLKARVGLVAADGLNGAVHLPVNVGTAQKWTSHRWIRAFKRTTGKALGW